MPVSYPYPLSFLSDVLPVLSVVWDIRRNDQLSGSGDGRVWQAELAPPLWTATIMLAIQTNADAEEIAAKIRKLHGSQEAFFLVNPASPFPKADPEGLLLGGAVVQVNSISAGRDAISLKGLPAGYKLRPSDKMAIPYGSSPTRYAFLEVSEPVTASGSGIAATFSVFPHVPTGVAVNDAVTLAKPYAKMILMPGSHQPGTAGLVVTEGAGFQAVQKK